MKNKTLILILIFSALIIINLSLNAVFMVASAKGNGAALALTYDDYVSVVLMNYVLNLSVPMIFSLYSIFEFKRARISNIYIFIWLILNLGAAGYAFFGMQILKIPTILLYIGNLAALLYLSTVKPDSYK